MATTVLNKHQSALSTGVEIPKGKTMYVCNNRRNPDCDGMKLVPADLLGTPECPKCDGPMQEVKGVG